MPNISIFQILNYYTKREALDPGFGVLDNSSNPRPDWFEYWPIRRFLLNEPLQEDAFYGFLSPRFKQKTNLSSAAAFEFVRANSEADIILLTPSLHLTAYYWNVFLYGEACHPGLLAVARKFFQRIGQPTNLEDLVTYSRNEVNSNYFVARPRFWRAWLEVMEQMTAIAESPDDSLGAELRQPTNYRGENNVPYKIFIMERVPTWILARDASFVVRAHDPFAARSRIYKLPGAIVCDALKMAYVQGGREQRYKDLFALVSRFGRLLNLQIRLGQLLGLKSVRTCLTALGSYWRKAGES